jgi:hypothetical protein
MIEQSERGGGRPRKSAGDWQLTASDYTTTFLRDFRDHPEHFRNRAGYEADAAAWSMLARMATSVSGKTASPVDVSSSTDHQR